MRLRAIKLFSFGKHDAKLRISYYRFGTIMIELRHIRYQGQNRSPIIITFLNGID